MRLVLWVAVLGAAGASALRAKRQRLDVRVRMQLARSALNPDAICVRTPGKGTVVLTGDVLAAERPSVMQAASCVRGVRNVEDRLTVHHNAQGMPVQERSF
jgi:osmotically-inducible protein OsmY